MSSEARLQRRTFLGALGLGLSAPLALHFSRMVVAAPGPRPARLLVYYMPHGVPNEHMDMAPYMTFDGEFASFGQNPQSPLSTVHVNPDYTFETRTGQNLLSPLEPYRSTLHVVRGLYQSGTFNTHDSIAAILTGGVAGPSVDQLVASELGVRSLFLGAVTRQNETLDTTNGVLVRDGSDWLVSQNDVVALYDQMFGSIGPDPDAGTTPDLSPEFRAEALGLTVEEVTALRQQVSGLTQTDNKLAAHLTALEKLKTDGGGLGPPVGEACRSAPLIPHIDELRTADVGKQEWEPRYWREGRHFEKIAEAQAEMAAYALLCGHAQVVTLQNMWASADIPLPGVLPNRPTEPHHLGISHKGFTGDFNDGPRRDFATAQQWFLARVARICQILNQPDPFDPTHTVFDNTLIYVCSEIADGDLHGKSLARQWRGQQNDMFQYYPALILGGAAAALKPGSLVTVDNRPIADLLLTLARAMGSSATSFGGGSRVIQEILA
jgi:hypothetical protein